MMNATGPVSNRRAAEANASEHEQWVRGCQFKMPEIPAGTHLSVPAPDDQSYLLLVAELMKTSLGQDVKINQPNLLTLFDSESDLPFVGPISGMPATRVVSLKTKAAPTTSGDCAISCCCTSNANTNI